MTTAKLANAIKGSRHTPQQITWRDEDGNAVNLTGATLSGHIRSRETNETREIDGTLALATAAEGKFTWTYGVEDVKTEGSYEVQFSASYADETVDRTFICPWAVLPSLA